MNAKTQKPDFSNVQGGFENDAPKKPAAPDFGNVSGEFSSQAEVTKPVEEALRTHTVERGDSLSKISRKVYGSSKHWRAIFEANRDQIDNPDLIHPGQVLKIPSLPDADA